MMRYIVMICLLASSYGFVSRSSRSAGTAGLTMMARKKKEMPANPVAVVTGASRGIGKAIAIALGIVTKTVHTCCNCAVQHKLIDNIWFNLTYDLLICCIFCIMYKK